MSDFWFLSSLKPESICVGFCRGNQIYSFSRCYLHINTGPSWYSQPLNQLMFLLFFTQQPRKCFKKVCTLPAVVGSTAVEHFFLKSAYSNGTYTSTTKPGGCVCSIKKKNTHHTQDSSSSSNHFHCSLPLKIPWQHSTIPHSAQGNSCVL